MRWNDKPLQITKSRLNFLIDIWREQPPGYVFIVATQGQRRIERWSRSDNADRLEAILLKYSDPSWRIDFTPSTYKRPMRKRAYANRSAWAWALVEPKDLDTTRRPRPQELFGRVEWDKREFKVALWKLDEPATVPVVEMYLHNLSPFSHDNKRVLSPKITTMLPLQP